MKEKTSTDASYQKLRKYLDTLPIGYPATESGVEIRILKRLFTPKEAELALYLKLIPESAEKIFKKAKKMNLSQGEVEKILRSMSEKGAIASIYTRGGVELYSITMLAIGMFEFQVDRMTKEFYQDFHQYINEAYMAEMLTTKIPQLRTIPIESSHMPDIPIDTYDNIRTLITEFKGPMLVANCICKQGEDLLGNPCKVTDEREVCLIFGSAARKYDKEGWGRIITKDECFKILEKAEKDGLVLQPSNTQKLFCLCLCCGCCCEILTNVKDLENPVQYFHTNYYAINDMEKCIGCGICVKRCQMDAIKIEDKKAIIDLTRCIGCGLCVPTCTPKSMALKKKDKVFVPPKGSLQLYLKILKKRIGNARFILMITKQMLGKKFG
jgi:H+/Na+-translocating ferredoxin:NAD+ oxidoreductase subunit B